MIHFSGAPLICSKNMQKQAIFFLTIGKLHPKYSKHRIQHIGVSATKKQHLVVYGR
jgi:hypothetical protein